MGRCPVHVRVGPMPSDGHCSRCHGSPRTDPGVVRRPVSGERMIRLGARSGVPLESGPAAQGCCRCSGSRVRGCRGGPGCGVGFGTHHRSPGFVPKVLPLNFFSWWRSAPSAGSVEGWLGPKGTSSIGRAAVSKTAGWGFKSLVPCKGASRAAGLVRSAVRHVPSMLVGRPARKRHRGVLVPVPPGAPAGASQKTRTGAVRGR